MYHEPQKQETAQASAARRRLARDAANRWLARFAPLVEENTILSTGDVRARLDLIESLRQESGIVERDLAGVMEPDDAALLSTLQMAAGQLDTVETAFKRRLASLAPGDPEGIVDLYALREDLSEIAARREIGDVGTGHPAALKLNISRPNIATAAMSGLFCLGWMSFTTVHAAFMIGGMYMAFGWPALFMLLFYSMFWAAGIGIGWTAVKAMTAENITLDGRELTLERSVMGRVRTQRFRLGRDSRASISYVSSAGPSNRSIPQREIMLLDEENNEVSFGRGASPVLQEQNIKQINAYLEAQGR